MTSQRIALHDCPDWPLYLSRDEAARYVGVSPSLFDIEVKQGLWPAGEYRGQKNGRITWYRPAIDAAAAARHGISNPVVDYWERRDADRASRKARMLTAARGFRSEGD